MPQTEEMVREQIEKLGKIDSWGTKKEIKYLPETLDIDEKILGLCSGFHDGNTWLITITDKRVLFLDKGMIYGLKQMDVRYEQITAVGHKKGMLLASIQVDTPSQKMLIDNVQKEDAPKIATLIREQIEIRDRRNNQPAQLAIPQPEDLISQLERLGGLKQSGLLSEAEFEQAKKKLLS